MNRWALLGVLMLVAVIAAVTLFLGRSGEKVQAARVAEKPMREFVDEEGKTRLPVVHMVTMPFAGKIEAIELEEGDAVEVGQIVAQVSKKDLEDEVAEAKAAVERLDASIAENRDNSIENNSLQQAKYFVESMASTVAAAQARLTAGEERMRVAESYLGRILETGRATSEDRKEAAQLSFVESKVNFQQDRLVHAAVAAMESATKLLPEMITSYIDRKSLSRAVLEKQKEETEARLRQMITRQERGSMASPIQGVVLDRPENSERYVAAGELLLTLGDLNQLEVEADFLSQDVVRMKSGDAVEIYGPAIGGPLGKGVKGTVDRISKAGFTKLSSLGVEQQRVTVVIHFEQSAEESMVQKLKQDRNIDLGVGFRVRVRVFTRNKENALVIPRSAILRGADGGWQAFAIVAGQVELRNIELGLMNDDDVEVVKGLSKGDLVILAPESRLTAGARVTAVTRDVE
jgi:HlyD family secretion protein